MLMMFGCTPSSRMSRASRRTRVASLAWAAMGVIFLMATLFLVARSSADTTTPYEPRPTCLRSAYRRSRRNLMPPARVVVWAGRDMVGVYGVVALGGVS